MKGTGLGERQEGEEAEGGNQEKGRRLDESEEGAEEGKVRDKEEEEREAEQGEEEAGDGGAPAAPAHPPPHTGTYASVNTDVR